MVRHSDRAMLVAVVILFSFSSQAVAPGTSGTGSTGGRAGNTHLTDACNIQDGRLSLEAERFT